MQKIFKERINQNNEISDIPTIQGNSVNIGDCNVMSEIIYGQDSLQQFADMQLGSLCKKIDFKVPEYVVSLKLTTQKKYVPGRGSDYLSHTDGYKEQHIGQNVYTSCSIASSLQEVIAHDKHNSLCDNRIKINPIYPIEIALGSNMRLKMM